MSLLSEFLAIVQDWRGVFPQQRTFQRAVRQALGSLVCLGRRCLTRIIWTNGGQNRGWSAEYFLHSRCQWEPQQLFQPILNRALAFCPQRGCGHRRYPAEEDGTCDSTGLLSTRSIVAAVSPQSGAGLALSAGVPAGAAAPPCPGRHTRLADSLPGSFADQAPRQES